MPTRHSNCILKKMASAQNNVASQRKEAPDAAALTGKRKLQSLGRKNLLARTSCCDRYFSSKEEGSEEEKEIWCTGQKEVPLAELEVQYTTTGTKVYANLCDDSDNEDFVADDDSN